jgi:hypothetical protein
VALGGRVTAPRPWGVAGNESQINHDAIKGVSVKLCRQVVLALSSTPSSMVGWKVAPGHQR